MKTIQILVCILFAFLCNFPSTILVNADAQKDVTVTVLVSPQYRTVKIGETSPRQMTVQGIYNGKPIVNSEELVGDVEWLYVGEKHTAGHSVSIMLTNPTKPTWSSSNTVEMNVTTQTDGETTVEVTMKVRFRIHKKKSSGSNAQQGVFLRYSEEFTGIGVATINGTNKNFRVVIVPNERFDGRSSTRLGVEESGRICALNLSPIDTGDPDDIVQLINVVSSDDKKLSLGSIETISNVKYYRIKAKPPEPCTVTITVTASWRGVVDTESIDVDIVEPTGAGLVRVLAEKVFHEQNTCSTGFVGLYYYLPSDVSFVSFVSLNGIYEGDCEQENARGYFEGENFPHKSKNLVATLSKLESGISPITLKPNSRIYDNINRPYDTICDHAYIRLPLEGIRAGQMEWNIPIYYRNFRYDSQFEEQPPAKKCSNTVRQFFEIRDDGSVRITKSEGYSESDVNDEGYTDGYWEGVRQKQK